MTGYSELVKALRFETDYVAVEKTMRDAAAAIEALQAELERKRTADCFGCKCEKVEPKRGEWKPFDLTYGRSIYSCSVCEQATEVPVCMEKPMYAYCPNCGAKMEGQE